MRLVALLLLGLLAAGAVVDAAGGQGPHGGKGKLRRGNRKGTGKNQGHRKSMVRVNGGGVKVHKAGPGGHRVRKPGHKAAGKKHGRHLNQWGVDAILNGVTYGINTGINVVAPFVNKVASNVPVLVPALPGPKCLNGDLVILGENHDLYFCDVGTGDQVTNAMFNAASGVTGAVGTYIPNLVSGCWQCIGQGLLDGLKGFAGKLPGLGALDGIPLDLPWDGDNFGGPISNGPFNVRNSGPGPIINGPVNVRNSGPGPVSNGPVNVRNSGPGPIRGVAPNTVRNTGTGPIRGTNSGPVSNGNGAGPVVVPLSGPGSVGFTPSSNTAPAGSGVRSRSPAPANTRPVTTPNTRTNAPSPAPRNTRANAPSPAPRNAGPSNVRLPNGAAPVPNKVQG